MFGSTTRVYILLTILLCLGINANVYAQKGKKKAINDSTIEWKTVNEVEALIKKKPKKVLLDMYTDWCGWCKVMDKKTYSQKDIIRYINENFYAIKFNAEQKEDLVFKGQTFKFQPDNRAHDWAVSVMQGKMSYPTTIFLDENFDTPIPVPGYLAPEKMEMILKYIGTNTYKTTQYPEYEKNFKNEWQFEAK